MDEKTKNLNIIDISNITQKQIKNENLIYKELIYTKDESILPIKYTRKLIEKYLNDTEKKIDMKIKYKGKMRNLIYIGKILKNKNKKLRKKEKNEIKGKEIFLRFFISFNKNIWILFENYSKAKSNENNKIIVNLKNLFKLILKLIGASYILGFIKDDSFELIMKIVLDFSLEKISENKGEKIEDLKYMIFFNESIKLIKDIFNHFNEYSQRKIDIIKNILVHINNNILGSLEKNNINYSNKYFLSKSEYKTSLIINLAYIITKINSDDIKNIYMNLLTSIYSFEFHYENSMKPILKLLEPLFFNLNNKNIEDINDGIKISDFSLNYLNALINKEKEILQKESCMLKQGFYLGDKKSVIYGDINNLENDIFIIFGFKLESNELYNVSLFEIYRKELTLIKFYLTKDLNNVYELQIEDDRMNSTRVNIEIRKAYIFIFHISFKKKEIKIIYIKDTENKENNKEWDMKINLGKETKLKIKNLKLDNLKICFGCKRINNRFQNNFVGFIGNFIILNMKHIKDKNEQVLNNLYIDLLNLKSDYFEIENILSNNENFFQKDNYKLDYNSIYNERNRNIEKLINNEKFRTNFSINTIIMPRFFKLVEYHDDIDLINKNYEYYSEKLSKPFSVKYKYIIRNPKVKPETIYKKAFNMNTSLFNRNFHAFERKFSLLEFIKYKGIHYLSLLIEYYYQITCHLIQIKNKVDVNIFSSTCKEINEKLIKILKFFDINIIQTKLYQYKIDETKQFFYQVVIMILKYVEIEELNKNIFKILCELLSAFDYDLKSNIDDNVTKFLLLIRKKLFQILINPRLFKEKNKENYEKLNYVFLSLLTFLKNNEIRNLKNILKNEHLEILISYIWLLDLPEDIKIFEITRNNYISFLILFIQIALSSQINADKNSKAMKERCDNSNEENQTNFFIYQIFNLSIENRKNKYIFYNLSLIMVKSNLITFLNKSDIEKMKEFFLEEFYNKELRNTDHKKTLYLSYLQILISYYSSKTSNQDLLNSNETFQSFLKESKILLDKDLFYAFISLLRIINNFAKLNKTEIMSYENEDLRKFSQNDYISFSNLPMNEIEINYLNELEIHIIKNIFLYIIYLLDELMLMKSLFKNKEKKTNQNNNSNHSQNSEDNIEEEAFEVTKKNLDIIFKYPKTKLYEVIFCSKSNIFSNLFLIKWKYGDEKDINYVKSNLKKYYIELVENIFCPFVYKFLLDISNHNIFQNDYLEEEYKKSIELNFKADIIVYIIGILNTLYLNLSKDRIPYFIFNSLNLLIVINHELNYSTNDLFENKKLYEDLKLFISLISKGLLFSNYCIEMNDNPDNSEKTGKIVSEIIFDLLLAIPQKYFNKEYFINTLTRGKRRKISIFFAIDISKEFKKDKEKDKKKKKSIIPELDITKEYNNIISSYKNNKKNMNRYFVQDNKIYQIARTNYSMYFLAKCFVYLRSDMIKEEAKKENQLKEKEKESALIELIHYLSDDLFSLYTEYKLFYEMMPCGFLLYDETKKYFELNILQNYFNDNKKTSNILKSFDLYKKFFFNELIVTLKDKYKLEYCYSSKLKIKKNINAEIPSVKLEEEKPNNKIKSQDHKSNTSSENASINNKSSQNSSLLIAGSVLKARAASNFEMSLDITDDMVKTKDEIIETNIKEFNHSFELIKENLTIVNPRNFFFKKIFSEAFKELLFTNKAFIDIKKLYIIKYRDKRGFKRESKQINYPTNQKNFSNFLEPRIFLRRDYNFFDKIFFPISFCYLNDSFVKDKLEDFYLYKHKFKYKKEKIKLELACELVTSKDIHFGKMYLFEKYFIFAEEDDPRNSSEKGIETFINYCISTKDKDEKTINKDKFIPIFFNNIREAIKRRTLLVTQSIEIFLKNGKTYFFNFFKTKEAKKIYDFFNEKISEYNFIFSIDDNKKEIKNLLNKFHEGNISNYKYILELNKYSTRTYSDLSQYPVFPWLILKKNQLLENSSTNSEYKDIILRDMKYPISMQNPEKREKYINKFRREIIEGKFNNHFDNHYSSSAFIFYYLMRLNPYGQGMIKLQNYRNENANRMFMSFEGLEKILSLGVDNRELIPDFFCYFDYLINLNCSFFGEVSDNGINDDFTINLKESMKYSISSFVYNLYKDKKLLNSNLIKKIIHSWVDIIFGKNQIPEDENELAESCNIFNKLSYEQK